MGASSGWNLVARRPPRRRAASKPPARHLVLVPRTPGADPGRSRPEPTPPRDAGTTRDAG
jgi:hypothetical protein